MQEPIRIDQLNPTGNASRLHRFPVMKDGETVYLTVGQLIDLIVDGAPSALDTWLELVARLEDDGDAIATFVSALALKADADTTASALAKRLRVDSSQAFSTGEKVQALANLGVDAQALSLWQAGVSTKETVVSPANIAGAIAALNPFGNALFHVCEEQPSGTAGGAATGGANDRVFNTVRTNEIAGASLVSSRITLPTGNYWFEVEAPAVAVDGHILGFLSYPDLAVIVTGTSAFSAATTTPAQTLAKISRRVTIPAGGKTMILRHFCNTTKTSNGLGVQVARAGVPEVYTDVKIWRLK